MRRRPSIRVGQTVLPRRLESRSAAEQRRREGEDRAAAVALKQKLALVQAHDQLLNEALAFYLVQERNVRHVQLGIHEEDPLERRGDWRSYRFRRQQKVLCRPLPGRIDEKP